MRYSYLLGSILILFFAPMNVLAAKGCCSGHGGVDCTKIQQDERVVCNDGWLGSSCTYQSMDKYMDARMSKRSIITNLLLWIIIAVDTKKKMEIY